MNADYAALTGRARSAHLDIFGAFDADDGDELPDGSGTVILLGPHEPGFWARVTCEPEFGDGRPDPLDRWSCRVIGHIAADLGAKAYFPFTGPPYHPFIRWALRSGRAWSSPSGILVHDSAGLLVSYRGAIALGRVIEYPSGGASPCLSCTERPCLSACPVNAMTDGGYNVSACRRHIEGAPEGACMNGGCLARRACPLSRGYLRAPAQSAYHMRMFRK